MCSKECDLGSDTSSCLASGEGSGGRPEAGAGWKVLAVLWVRGAGDWGQGRDRGRMKRNDILNAA